MIEKINEPELKSGGRERLLELEYRKRFDRPGLWPPSTTEQEREDYMLWSYIHHVRARWDRDSRGLRPSLWLRAGVRARECWFVVRAMLKA